jgi:uncharacterized protein
MAIGSLNEDRFKEVLYSHLSPSRPVSSVHLLRGRTKKLQQIRQALASPGRHVFVYGDRGVGKTSLAQTAATVYQGPQGHFVTLSCAVPFFQLMHDLTARCQSAQRSNKAHGTIRLDDHGQPSADAIKVTASINEAIANLKEILPSNRPLIAVLDEFDLVTNDFEKQLFADFIKQVSDQNVPLKLVFTGIGRSITDLLNIHNSAFRYLETVELERLDHSARLEIVTSSANAFGITVEYNSQIRISQVSDGFPHYVHLICEKMFWNLFNKSEVVTRTTAADYVEAVDDAASSIQAFLREAYNTATRKYTNDYEEVLWAAADSPLLERPSTEIFQSYKRILAVRRKQQLESDQPALIEPADEDDLRRKFNGRINRLKTPAHGRILIGTRAGWYEFRENIVRGYVRIKAEQAGVPLEVDHPLLKTKFVRAESK